MAWDFIIGGIGTSVHIDGHFDPELCDPYVSDINRDEQAHGLFKMEAISMPCTNGDRRGEMKLDIRRRRGKNIPPNADAIVGFLSTEIQKLTEGRRPMRYRPHIQPPQEKCWTKTEFLISFVLGNSEQFCDTSIEIGRAVFTGLGVKDDTGISLAGFEIERETFVMIDKAWITFARWLRIKHRLPIYGPEDF